MDVRSKVEVFDDFMIRLNNAKNTGSENVKAFKTTLHQMLYQEDINPSSAIMLRRKDGTIDLLLVTAILNQTLETCLATESLKHFENSKSSLLSAAFPEPKGLFSAFTDEQKLYDAFRDLFNIGASVSLKEFALRNLLTISAPEGVPQKESSSNTQQYIKPPFPTVPPPPPPPPRNLRHNDFAYGLDSLISQLGESDGHPQLQTLAGILRKAQIKLDILKNTQKTDDALGNEKNDIAKIINGYMNYYGHAQNRTGETLLRELLPQPPETNRLTDWLFTPSKNALQHKAFCQAFGVQTVDEYLTCYKGHTELDEAFVQESFAQCIRII